MSSAAPAALEFRDVSVSFRGVRALDRVTVEVPTGGVTAIIGPNGAGKTTLLNCVSGIYRHDGAILLHGSSIARLPAHRRPSRGLARTYQTPALIEDLPALDNVMLGGHPVARGWAAGQGGRMREPALRERAGSLLARLGAGAIATRLAGDLPHGDRRRVEVARALLARPRVLLLDEPAAGLDEDEARHLLAVAERECDTCVLIEHNVSLVMSVARHIVVLASGQLLAVGAPADISRDQRVIDAYLGDEVPA
jgi:branched-chain amino acid transport system ATP-binding protein